MLDPVPVPLSGGSGLTPTEIMYASITKPSAVIRTMMTRDRARRSRAQ